ncbi:hypothetical protein [Uliginosibacterium gangwonense]|uniref:hypothetical protein n=1 Tax=Uliginosibacterium gangwonense TaxID=392736 RepID=UPI00036739AC|nr:hypothetical protein [Uliginosibacterium gangwonense]
MPLTIASWNIEKSGQSSPIEKQTKVNDFIAQQCNAPTDVLFLCEVHSARVEDYVDFLRSVHDTQYSVDSLDGGNSNNYICLVRRSSGVQNLSYAQLKGLNRSGLIFSWYNIWVVLAHFKSGQTGLTKDQLENAASFLDSVSSGRWGILGDMNWDYSKFGELDLPAGAHAATMWADQSQAKGGILDWCLAGSKTGLGTSNGYTYFGQFNPLIDMAGPDHRPIIFRLWEC